VTKTLRTLLRLGAGLLPLTLTSCTGQALLVPTGVTARGVAFAAACIVVTALLALGATRTGRVDHRVTRTTAIPHGPSPTGIRSTTRRVVRSMTETSFDGPLAV